MTIFETLTKFRTEVLNILELYEYQYSTPQIRNSIIHDLTYLLAQYDNDNIIIEDITDEIMVYSGHILLEFKDINTNETHIQKF